MGRSATTTTTRHQKRRKDGGAEPRPDLAIERGEMDGGLEGKMRISAERRSNIDDIEMNICEHI